ncbi:hypothetical protein [Tessaracoccus flavescens]|uniref:DUF4245 domain-containing protein n=1 Tax=Tessaracoccus flavescens TaxID=399497 RepID=A0A1Q2D1T3_9ACTN|nr:hypothetical protein [Tessaracoccus flavescens]AQP52327.1 hypothetical protein BW733_17340 [Tessaracoccus flavescens]
MSNQQWQGPQQGLPQQGAAGWQGPPPQQPYGAPSRKSNRLPLIIAAVLVAVALIGVGAWFLTRPGDPPPTADPSTPSTSKAADPTATPTVEKRRVAFDDLPPEVDGWRVKPAGTGAYYITDGREDPYGADAQINVTGADDDITVDTATTGLAGPIESPGRRVVCVPEDIVGNVSCFIQTSTFTLIVASATQEDGISLEEVQAIADAIAAKYP